MPGLLTPLTLGDLAAFVPRAGRAEYAVLGHPIGHSRSPVMQGAAFTAAGIDAGYHAIDVPGQELPAALTLLQEKGFAGWNATAPLKNALFEHLRATGRLAPSAFQAGAVNTVRREGDTLTGHSTDGPGWERALREEFDLPLRGLNLFIIGAGGAGATLARHAAAAGCAALRVANRTSERLATLDIPFIPVPWEAEALGEAMARSTLTVQTTPLGREGEDRLPLPLSATAFRPGAFYYDIVYGGAPTPFLRAAQAAGGHAAGGLSMLLHQGALAWEIWTGRPAPVEAMRRALLSSS